MKKILVPTDCSDLSGYALTLADKLAKQSGAEIYALRVVPTPANAVFNQQGQYVLGLHGPNLSLNTACSSNFNQTRGATSELSLSLSLLSLRFSHSRPPRVSRVGSSTALTC